MALTLCLDSGFLTLPEDTPNNRSILVIKGVPLSAFYYIIPRFFA